MGGLLYFIESDSASPKPDDRLLAEPLGHVLDDRTGTEAGRVFAGPSGKPGYVVTQQPATTAGASSPAVYKPTAQSWIVVETAPGQATHWVGYNLESPPTPVDLVRPRQVPGSAVRLADGALWTIPLVHAEQDGIHVTALPRKFTMTTTGPRLEPSAEYAELCRDAQLVFDCLWGEDRDAPWPLDELATLTFGARLLAVNYRVDLWSVGLLGVLDTLCKFDPLLAAVGVDAVAAELLAKKNAATPATGTPAPAGAPA